MLDAARVGVSTRRPSTRSDDANAEYEHTSPLQRADVPATGWPKDDVKDLADVVCLPWSRFDS